MVAYSFRRRFVDPIRVGLGLSLSVEGFAAGMDEFGNVSKPRPKRQTIRAIGKRRHARPGEVISLFFGLRTSQCFKIADARCVSVDPIEIDVREHTLPIRVFGDWLKGGLGNDFAHADGFEGLGDMHQFWKNEHGIGNFRGVLIKWEPVKT